MLFSHRRDSKLVLILEIQSSLVRGSLAYFTAGGSSILFSQSFDVAYEPGATTAYYVKTTLASVTSMIDATTRAWSTLKNSTPDMPGRIDEVHFVLSSPWVVSQAKTVRINFERDTVISGDRVHTLLADERALAQANTKGETQTIEEKVFDVKLNGYSIAAWKGKAARTLEVSYAFSIGGSDSMDKLRTAVSRLVSGHNIFFHSSLLLQYISLREAHNIPGDTYVLIHAHGELTDMVAVRRGTCSFFGSFPIGINAIIRKIGDFTHTDSKTAESYLSLYLGNHLEQAEHDRASMIIQSLSRSWTTDLSQLWANAGTEAGGEPQSIFIIAHSHEDFFERGVHALYPRASVRPLNVDMVSTYAGAVRSLIL